MTSWPEELGRRTGRNRERAKKETRQIRAVGREDGREGREGKASISDLVKGTKGRKEGTKQKRKLGKSGVSMWESNNPCEGRGGGGDENICTGPEAGHAGISLRKTKDKEPSRKKAETCVEKKKHTTCSERKKTGCANSST